MNGTCSTRAGQKGAPVSKKSTCRQCGKSHPLTCSIPSVWAPKSQKTFQLMEIQLAGVICLVILRREVRGDVAQKSPDSLDLFV